MTSINRNLLLASHFVDVDGLQIRFAQSDGTKSGDPILLLCPWPESLYAFLPTWEMFSNLGPVLAVDLPGFGGSQGRPDVMAPEPMGEFILRIVEAFGLDSPHAVGPDVGTPSLLFAAASHPGIFKSLVIGSGATDHTDVGGILNELVNAPSLEPYRTMSGEDFVRGATNDLKKYKLPDEVLKDYIASYSGDRFFESVQFVRDYPNSLPQLARRLSEIEIPVQIIVGQHDPFVPVSNAKGLHAGLPRSKLDILDCGHFAWEDGAGEYGRLASEWIKGGCAQVGRPSEGGP
jgi:pimeloyl-ACP methyl ester carboxylesterase